MRVFCQDESRIGLHLSPGRRLTARGIKPLKGIAPVYDYYGLYAAVEPTSGEACWVELPRLDRACFQVFLDQFSRQYVDSLNLRVLDNAPAHVAHDLQVPANVVLIDLPPYCPELNPVERLWQDLKRRLPALAAATRLSITTWREAVDGFIRAYPSEQLASLTGYPSRRRIIMH